MALDRTRNPFRKSTAYSVFFLFLVTCSFAGCTTKPKETLAPLVDAPWNQSPAVLLHDPAWQVKPYGELDAREHPGYALRGFTRQESDSLRITLLTYAVPSLTSATELVLRGFCELTLPSYAAARQRQKVILKDLKGRGFTVDSTSQTPPPESLHEAGPWVKQEVSVATVKAGKLSGSITCRPTQYAGEVPPAGETFPWTIRVSFTHERFYACDDSPEKYGSWRPSEHGLYRMPEAFVHALEAHGIARRVGAAGWSKLKRMSRSSQDSYIPEQARVPFGELMALYDAADRLPVSGKDGPLFALFRDYVARYLFRVGSVRDIKAHRPWLDRHGLRYRFMDSGRTCVYLYNLASDLASHHADTPWGQVAFLQLIETGFDPAGLCPPDSLLTPAVLEKGQAFLREHPDAGIVPAVLFYMGNAEETRFNRSLRNGKESAVSETSRKNAIEDYERLLKTGHAQPYEAQLKYILPRLRLGCNTGHMYFAYTDE